MTRLKAFQQVIKQYADIADSLLVYIEEAHPSDGWVSSDAPYQIPKHRCLEDRLKAAKLMNQEVPGCLIVADSMDNSSNAAYGAYFDRLYILQEGKIVYQGGRGPERYRISELKNCYLHSVVLSYCCEGRFLKGF
uniref:Iodothyronine deiodinase n=1 Tax=Electrophorus electricus TaxID=8005 RepID=A0A4W4EFV0_ELEEL